MAPLVPLANTSSRPVEREVAAGADVKLPPSDPQLDQPVALEGEVVIRRRMRLTMSCDHRVIDGATGARFLQTLKGMLENPLAMVY